MDILLIIFIVLALLALIGQVFLYKEHPSTVVFLFNGLLAIIFSWMIFTSLPTNFTNEKIIASIWGIIAMISVIMQFSNRKLYTLSKLLLSVAVVGGLIHLFIG